MNTTFKLTILVVFAAISTLFQCHGADKQPATISVAKTEGSAISGWQPAMGEGLAHMLITELSKLSNFKVLESVALDDLRAERKLGEDGEVAESEMVKKGQWKGADYTLKSTVRRRK